MTAVPPPGELAAAIEAGAGWADDEAAGGVPAKWVLAQLIAAARSWAAAARGKAALP